MPKVVLKHKNESFESLLRRFTRAVEKDGTMLTYKEKQEFVKPSVKNRLEREKAVSREKRRFRESMTTGVKIPE